MLNSLQSQRKLNAEVKELCAKKLNAEVREFCAELHRASFMETSAERCVKKG
jgi:hypothetical protein